MLTYRSDASGIGAEQLRGFFVDWPKPPSPQRHLELLRGSYAVELAVDDERVVAFATAVSDGVLAAYVPLLEVLPEWQGRGIGTELVRRLLTRLGGLYMIDVVCDPDLVPFYERLGLQPVGSALGVRNRDAI